MLKGTRGIEKCIDGPVPVGKPDRQENKCKQLDELLSQKWNIATVTAFRSVAFVDLDFCEWMV